MLQLNVCNISNIGREIYVWHRIGKTLSLFKDKTFFPYFYQLAPNGIFRTIDNKKVNKIVCARPSDLKNRRDENSYEADINFCKRYIIDKISSFGKVELKYSFIDIEVLTEVLPNYLYPEQPISCISCSNSYTGEIKTFYLKDYLDPRISVPNWNEPEKKLLNDFVKWIKEQQFDLLLGWNFIEFDWLYLCARYKKVFGCELAEMLSPIAKYNYLGTSQKVEPTLVPAGISIMDYLEMYKKIYRTEPSYALDAVCQKELKESSYKKVDFSRLSDEIKEKNINDVRRMIELEKKKKIIEYYDELRRMSMCEWSDVTWNSKMLDMILLREAKQKGIILPSKHYGEGVEVEEIGFEGAYRRCDTGLYKGLYKLDLASAYPMAIINFCLDISNIKNEGITINKVKFYQNENALLPTIARKLISKKDILKSQLKSTNPETEEYKDLQIKYDAIKAVVNSLFGVCGLKIFRLFDYRVAAAITFLIRDLLHYIEDELNKRSVKVIYIDTDSVFIEASDNPKDLCNELVKQWAKEKYNKDKMGIEFDLEGQFEKLFIIALCHYKGYLCVDEQTEILTTNGWKKYNELKIGERVATYNLKKQYIEYQQNSWIRKYNYNDYLYKIGNSKTIEMFVTPNHKNLIIKNGKEYLKEIKEITSRDKIKVLAPVKYYSNYSIGELWAYLVGWVLSEGYLGNVRGYKYITIGQKKKQYVEKIERALKMSGIRYRSHIDKKNMTYFIISNTPFVDWFLKNVPNKQLNKKLVNLPINELNKILQSLLEGDGHKNKNNTWEFYQKNKTFIDWFEILAMRCGWHTKTKKHRDQLVVHLSNKDNIGIRSTNGKKLNIQKIKYNGIVWCPCTKNKTWVAKRNGSIFITGNSTPRGVKEEIKGIEARRKDSSNFIREFQTNLIEKIMNEETQEEIVRFINDEKIRIKSLPLIDIGFPCRISKEVDSYKSIPVFMRALQYTQELVPSFQKNTGDSFYWLPVIPFGKSIRKSSRNKTDKKTGEKSIQSSEKEVNKDVLCYDEDVYNHIKEVNWEKIIDKSITMKCEAIFLALKWDLSLIKEIKVKKERKKTIPTQEELNEELKKRGLI